jgi:hypothetical protein
MQCQVNGILAAYSIKGAVGDVIAIEVDIDSRLLWFQDATAGTGWSDPMGTFTGQPEAGTGGISFSAMPTAGGVMIIGSGFNFGGMPNKLLLNTGPSVSKVNFSALVSSGFAPWDSAQTPPPPPPPPSLTIRGTPYPFVPVNSGGFNTAVVANGAGNNGALISGTVTLTAGGSTNSWFYGGTVPPGRMTLQYYLDGKAISPQIQDSTNQFGGPPAFAYRWDSTKFLDGSSVPDGSHVLHGLFIDYTAGAAYYMRTFAGSFLIYNRGSVPADPGPQTVAVAAGQNGMVRLFPPSWPDFVNYLGPSNHNPPNAAQGWPYKLNPPVPVNNNPDPSPLLVMEMLTGPRIYEYSTNPWWATTPSGGVYVLQMNVENGDPNETSQGPYLAQLGDCYADGGRCNNEVSWAATFVEAPDGSAWYGVEMPGRLFRLDHDGTVTTIAGYTKDFTKLKYDTQQRATPGNPSGISEAQFQSRMTFVGNNSAGGHDLGTATDLAFDPLDTTHKTMFVVKQADSCIVKVDMSTSPATITLFAGQDGNPGYVDVTTPGDIRVAQFDNPTSLAIASDGTMYIADTNNCVIRRIPPARTTVTTFLGTQSAKPTTAQVESNPANFYSPATGLAFTDPSLVIVYPFTLRLTSNGDLVFFENMTLHIRRINLSGANASRVTSVGFWGQTAAQTPRFGVHGPFSWSWLDVDTAGVFGRVDDIFAAQWDSGDGTSENYFRISLDGTQFFADGGGTPFGQCSGSPFSVNDGWAHYPWAIAISKFESRFLATGFANNGVCCVRAMQPGDVYPDLPSPDGPFFDSSAFMSGQYVFATGTVSGRGTDANIWPGNQYHPVPGVSNVFPFNSRPSFWGIRGNAGCGHLGVFSVNGQDANSFDALAAAFPSTSPGDAGDQALAAYIQSGFGGSVPRPEISGNDMRDLIYFIRYNTMVGSIGTGTPQRLPVQPAPDHPDTGNYPTITSISATRIDATTITVNWTTDKPTIGFAAAGGQSQVGLPSEVLYPVWSPIENFPTPSSNSTYQTRHSATISNCPAGLLLHYTAVAKDLAGNSVYASDQVMPAYVSPDGTQIDTLNSLGGAVYNGYGKWEFGQALTPPTAAGSGVDGPFGNFCYVKLNGKIVNLDNIPAAQAIRVDLGGNVFFLTTQNDRWWFQFVEYYAASFLVGSPFINPASVVTSPAPPTSFNPPYTASADGTTISGGTGSLKTVEGVWTFGSGSVNWPILLNGITVHPPGSNALQMQVNKGGFYSPRSRATTTGMFS